MRKLNKIRKRRARLVRLYMFRMKKWKKYKRIRKERRKRILTGLIRQSMHAAKSLNNNVEYQLVAPTDFRLLENTKECNEWFDKLRSRQYEELNSDNMYEINVDFKNVKHIDFSATMVLKAICDELKLDEDPCYMKGRLPDRSEAKEYIRQSGFLDGMYDEKGRFYPPSASTQRMSIKKGQSKLGEAELNMIADMSEAVYFHLTKEQGSELYHSEMLKEICGNTVDWSDAKHEQFTIGCKFEDNKVIVVALDLGKGILKSLYINYLQHIKDILFYGDVKILQGAFNKKYGSNTRESNRNKGLPSIQQANRSGRIRNLRVVTNNVMLDFSDDSKSRLFEPSKEDGFKGTLYSWVIDNNCLNR